MKKLALDRPKVSQVTGWDLVAKDFREQDWRGRLPGTCEVYTAENYFDYFKVVTFEGAGANKKTKYFFGERAWMDAQRYAGDWGCTVNLQGG